jgi:hypothetical protein
MKTYTITISDELDADIQYLIESGNTNIFHIPFNDGTFTFEAYIQSTIDSVLKNIPNRVNQLKDEKILAKVKSDPIILTNIKDKIEVDKLIKQ